MFVPARPSMARRPSHAAGRGTGGRKGCGNGWEGLINVQKEKGQREERDGTGMKPRLACSVITELVPVFSESCGATEPPPDSAQRRRTGH